MTLRNRHNRSRDHSGTLGTTSVDYNGVSLTDLIQGWVDDIGGFSPETSKTFQVEAVIRKTIEWQLVPAYFRMDAVIGAFSITPQAFPGHFTANAVKFRGGSGSFAIDAVVI